MSLTASWRERTPSLANTDDKWHLTVLSATYSREAISRLERSITTRPSTCFSRPESVGASSSRRCVAGTATWPTEIAQTVGRALVQHYSVRKDWGAMNYTVHEAIEKEESGETKKTILKHLRTADDRRAAEAAMREMHRLLEAYAESLSRRHPA